MLIKILRIIFLLPIVGLAQQAAASRPQSHTRMNNLNLRVSMYKSMEHVACLTTAWLSK